MVEISLKSGSAGKCREDAIVIPMLAGRKLTQAANDLPDSVQEFLKTFIRRFDMHGKFGEVEFLHGLEGLFSFRLVLVGVGEEKKMDAHRLRRLSSIVARRLEKSGARSAALYLTDIQIKHANTAVKVQAITEGIELGLYTFVQHKSKPKKNNHPLQLIRIMLPSRDHKETAICQQALQRGLAISAGVNFSRDLGNQPGNVCTPEYLAEQALTLQDDKLQVEVMDKAAIEAAGFRALLAVNQGSAKEPRFIIMRYQGGEQTENPIALVGKGLTFDAGGISIKPGPAMDEMKFDMCGAAAVLGIFKAASALNLHANLLGVIPATENLLGADAYKPGDILTAYNGTTIEILNTDAEGRLILADALAYTSEQKPREIIDFATLTGAAVVALGSQASALLGNNSKLLKELGKSGDRTHDRLWNLPMYEEYHQQIKSHIADIRNIGGREAGTITAACFLSRFIDGLPWAHIDIAGTAWKMTASDLSIKGATGAGVRLTLDYLIQQFEEKIDVDDHDEIEE